VCLSVLDWAYLTEIGIDGRVIMRLVCEKWGERTWTCPDLMRIGLNKKSNRF